MKANVCTFTGKEYKNKYAPLGFYFMYMRVLWMSDCTYHHVALGYYIDFTKHVFLFIATLGPLQHSQKKL